MADHLKAFPKIHALGTKYVESIFNEPVEITEKIDGSQFVFGRIDGELLFRSKGAEIFPNRSNKMFAPAVDVVQKINIPDGMAFYCEYLQKPKHNVLAYNRIPTSYLALFGISNYKKDELYSNYEDILEWANGLGIECVPLLYQGMTTSKDVLKMLDTESVLGNQKIEGIIVKNYKDTFIADRVYPVMAAKFVSKRFKEVHRKTWNSENTSGGKWHTFKESYRTEARWMKSVQHLRDKGNLQCDPKDIGNLINEIKIDIKEECIEDIKDFLWREYGDDLLRRSVAGFPEWYKEQLALGNIK